MKMVISGLVKQILGLLLLALLAACAQTPAATAQPAPSATPRVFVTTAPEAGTAPTPTGTAARTATRPAATAPAATAPTAVPAATAAAYTDLPLGSANVRLFIADLQTVTQADFTLTGQAPAGTVVSINDQFVMVGADQKFSLPLKLEEGPNLLEIEVSDALGQDNTLGLVLVLDTSP